jgi:AcrR family transcriptional regulator
VLDAAVASVLEVGYYKATSNEIARRAGVSWGSIDHLFGSREQLMIDVVNDLGLQMERLFADATVEGDTLVARLAAVMDTLSYHYDSDRYLVQMQILLELSATSRVTERGLDDLASQDGERFDRLAQPLLTKALGEVAAERDLVVFVFMAMRGYLGSAAVSRRVAALPQGTVARMMGAPGDEAKIRHLLVRGLAASVREEATARGYQVGE